MLNSKDGPAKDKSPNYNSQPKAIQKETKNKTYFKANVQPSYNTNEQLENRTKKPIARR